MLRKKQQNDVETRKKKNEEKYNILKWTTQCRLRENEILNSSWEWDANAQKSMHNAIIKCALDAEKRDSNSICKRKNKYKHSYATQRTVHSVKWYLMTYHDMIFAISFAVSPYACIFGYLDDVYVCVQNASSYFNSSYEVIAIVLTTLGPTLNATDFFFPLCVFLFYSYFVFIWC